MDQIFCFAPSIKPDIEPVVSSTKQTSMRGLAGLAAASLLLDFDAPKAWLVRTIRPQDKRIFAVVFMVCQAGFSRRLVLVHANVGRRARRNAPHRSRKTSRLGPAGCRNGRSAKCFHVR